MQAASGLYSRPAIDTIIAIIAINTILIDNICHGSDNGLAIMLGRDDHTRERLALSILILAASGHQGFLSLASPGMALPSRPDRG